MSEGQGQVHIGDVCQKIFSKSKFLVVFLYFISRNEVKCIM